MIASITLGTVYKWRGACRRDTGWRHRGLRDGCPYVRTHLWLPPLKISRRRLLAWLGWHGRSTSWVNYPTWYGRGAIGSCPPWRAKELEWYREVTILRERRAVEVPWWLWGHRLGLIFPLILKDPACVMLIPCSVWELEMNVNSNDLVIQCLIIQS